MLKNNFQETLLILVHAVIRVNHKEIINEAFLLHLNKVQKINSLYKGRLHRWFQGVFFELYAWNAGPVSVTENS